MHPCLIPRLAAGLAALALVSCGGDRPARDDRPIADAQSAADAPANVLTVTAADYS
jgi:hypothetical protein